MTEPDPPICTCSPDVAHLAGRLLAGLEVDPCQVHEPTTTPHGTPAALNDDAALLGPLRAALGADLTNL